MSKYIPGNQKHLTPDDRKYIEKSLNQGLSFKEIAKEKENHEVKQMKAGQSEGTCALLVLFEEMDGVWLHMQDEHHRKMKKQEMKVCTLYEGWEERKRGPQYPVREDHAGGNGG